MSHDRLFGFFYGTAFGAATIASHLLNDGKFIVLALAAALFCYLGGAIKQRIK